MNKKNIIIGALVATITFCVGCNEAEAQEEVVVQKNWQFDTEVGYYEKRMSGGLYGAQDAAYVKASTKLGNFKGLSSVGHGVPARIRRHVQLGHLGRSEAMSLPGS